MNAVRSAFFVLLAMLSAPAFATPVRVHVTGPSGSPLKGALVIIQDLHGDTEREFSRELTDAAGDISLDNVEPGLYRAIATDPYRSWKTEVEEFLVKDQPATVNLALARQITDDPVVAAVGKLMVHVLTSTGTPAAGARVLLRDADAHPHEEHWGTTDPKGDVSLDVTQNSSVLVIDYGGRLHKFPANSYDTERTVHL